MDSCLSLTTFLASVRERLGKATPIKEICHELLGDTGQWAKVRGLPSHSAYLANYFKLEDATFIAHAPADLAKLIDICEIQADALNYAKGQVIGTVEAHYWQMGKEYLAKDAANKACAYLDRAQEKVAAICAGEAGGKHE